MASPASSNVSQTKVNSTWLWNTALIEKEPSSIIEFLLKNKVNQLYLQVNRDLPQKSYQQFIELASEKGIDIFALDGSEKWLDDKDDRKELFIKWLHEYQENSSADQKFAGIHLDIEPYLNKKWKSNFEITVEKYQSILMEIKKEAGLLNLPLTVDIPFWFDNTIFSNKKYGKAALSNWVIRNTAGVTIMAYRDSADGKNGIYALTLNEISYASRYNKKVEIAIETKPLKNQDYLTFYEEGYEKMINVLNQLNSKYQKQRSFNGFAVHSYEYWKVLK
jgi:hypothetical protein